MAAAGEPNAAADTHRRRRLAVRILLGVGLLVIICGVLVNVFTDTDIMWLLLVYLAGMVMLLMGGFLLVRLSD